MRFFKIGSIVLLVISASHLAGHFMLVPHFQLNNNFTGAIPSNETEVKLLSLMNHYHKRIGGSPMSMMDIQNGLSLCYSLFFLWAGILNLMIYQSLRRNRIMLIRLSYLNSAILFLGAIISLVYFFWLPVLSFATAMVLFLVAARTTRRH